MFSHPSYFIRNTVDQSTLSAVLWPTPLIDLASAYDRILRGWLRMCLKAEATESIRVIAFDQ